MFITKEDFLAKVKWFTESEPNKESRNPVGYWKDANDRWVYYERIINIIRSKASGDASSLELGTMGIPIFVNGHQMDYDRHAVYYSGGRPDYIHDVRCIPWPVESNRYDWFIASRVYHHLWPVQRECFEEARRIARNVILVVPEVLPPGGGTAILPEQFREWLGGVRPDIIEPAGRFGYIYVWYQP